MCYGNSQSSLMIDPDYSLYSNLADRLDYNYLNTSIEVTYAKSVS